MFTILHKRRRDGEIPTDNIFSAVQVQYIPPHDDVGDTFGLHLLRGPGEVEDDPSVRCGQLRDGVAFVMNDKGATVATYHLDMPRPAPPKLAAA